MYRNILSAKIKHEWNEVTINTLNNIFNQKLQLTGDIFSLLIENLANNADKFATNLKFSTLLLTLISKYPSEITPNVIHFKQIVLRCNNYLTKAILQKVEKLK